MNSPPPPVRILRELRLVLALCAALVGIGTAGYLIIDPTHTGPFEALYMTVITLTTTGFSEYPGITPAARVFTLILLVFGYGIMALMIARMTELFVIGSVFRDRRHRKVIRAMHDHVIVAGFGRIGQRVSHDLAMAGVHVVILEHDPDVRDAVEELGYTLKIGDATEESVLREAGIDRARGLIACLHSDADNLFLTLTAREMNQHLQIVSRAESMKNATKIKRAGADRVVSPYESGASQLVNAMIRPAMLDFVEVVSGRSTLSLAMEEFELRADGPWIGWSLKLAPIRKDYDVIVIALKSPDGSMTYNPPSDMKLRAGASMICVGMPEQVDALQARIGV